MKVKESTLKEEHLRIEPTDAMQAILDTFGIKIVDINAYVSSTVFYTGPDGEIDKTSTPVLHVQIKTDINSYNNEYYTRTPLRRFRRPNSDDAFICLGFLEKELINGRNHN